MLFMERNELCWCGSGKKYKKCHMPIEEKILLHSERGEIVPTRAILKTAEQIEKIKESARLNTAVLDEVAKHIRRYNAFPMRPLGWRSPKDTLYDFLLYGVTYV